MNLPNRQTVVKRNFCLSGASVPLALVQNCRMGKPNRIREWRKERKITLERLAELTGLSISYISRMEKGGREVSLKNLTKISTALRVPARDLVPPGAATVPMVGYIGAGAEAHLFSLGQGPFEEDIPAPDGSTENTVCVQIRGESLGALFDRWLVFYDDIRDPPTNDLINSLCVVGLADGRVLVKQLKPGQLPNRFSLFSNTEAPIYDVIVEWAARVKDMRPR